jgi:imidazolonepropionase-like amidohydrolase
VKLLIRVFVIIFFISFSWKNLLSQVAVKGVKVYTMADAAIDDGIVLVKGSKVERVGPASDIHIPAGYKVLTAKIVTPGLIDAHTVVGLAGYLNQSHDQDQLEKSDVIQPELRAIDAYNAREKLVEWLRYLGVTTIHTGHGPGALMSGQTMILKTVGDKAEDTAIKTSAMVAATLGSAVSNNFESPGTGSKGVAMLRTELVKARSYAEKSKNEDQTKRPARDLRMEVLVRILNKETPVLITAQTSTDIMSALRLAKEFDIEIVLDGAAEAYLLIDEVKSANVPVILHPTMVRNYGDTIDATYETAARLKAAGIPFAFQSGYESYVPKTRVVLYEAAIAVANGLTFEDALAALTIDAARILKIQDRVGSLETGKDADIVLFDGDPFEYTTKVCGVVISGEVVSEECR